MLPSTIQTLRSWIFSGLHLPADDVPIQRENCLVGLKTTLNPLRKHITPDTWQGWSLIQWWGLGTVKLHIAFLFHAWISFITMIGPDKSFSKRDNSCHFSFTFLRGVLIVVTHSWEIKNTSVKAGRHFTESWMRSQTGASEAIIYTFTVTCSYLSAQLLIRRLLVIVVIRISLITVDRNL